MADNVTMPLTGSGDATAVAATDEVQVGGTQPLGHVQFVKLVDGTLNGTAPIGGDVANGLDVDVTRVSGNVTVVQATATNLKVDASGVAVPVTDNAGSLTVDFTGQQTQDYDSGVGVQTQLVAGLVVPASGGGVAITGDAANGLDVDVTRVTGTVTVAGGKTNNNAAPGATNVGALPAVANSAAPTQVEGNLVALRATLTGDLAVTLDGEAVVLGAGAASIGNIGTVSTVTSLTQMNGQAISMNTGVRDAGTQRVTVATNDVVPVSDNAGSLTVDLANVENATLVDNAAFTDGTTRLVMGGFIFDDVAGTALTENDAAAARIDSKRALMVTIEDGTTRGTKAAVSANGLQVQQATAANLNANVSQATAANLLASVGGLAADAAAAAGNPVTMAATGRQTNRTAVTDGQNVRVAADDLGRIVVVPHQARDLVSHQSTQIASSAAETTIVTAGGVGVFNDLISLVITNQTGTAVNVTIKDSTAGTTRMIVALAANGGAVICPSRPIPQLAAANNNWTATLSNATTTVNIFALFSKEV